MRTSYSPDIATLDEHVSVEHDEEVPGELLVDSDSDNKLNLMIMRTTMARTKHLWRIARFSTPQKKRTIQLR